jgi:YidC/Oxa1 family membrane protein insertase
MSYLFHTIFYNPILNLLVFVYNIIPGHDIGFAIIILTVIIKIILLPLSKRALESQKTMQTIQPKLEALKEEHKGDKEALSREMMALYKREKVNPFSSCLPLLIQLPFFWAVFRVFRDELGGKVLTGLYPFIHNPGALDAIAFGFIDFSKPNIPLAVLAGVAQFLQTKMMPQPAPAKQGSKESTMTNIMSKQMLYFMPVITIFICISLPSGLSFYWLLTTLLTILQQMYLFKKVHNDKDDGLKVIEGEMVK